MTIDELKKRLNKIDPRLYLECVFSDIDNPNEPTGVWFKAPTKIYWQLFRIDKNDFYFEPLISEIAAVNQFIGLDAVKKVGDLLFKYFEPELSKESQKISNDSKNQNGSTAAFSKLASKDSQKKPLRIVDKDQFKKYQVKLFNERFCYYEFHKDLDDAINDFCLKHNVIKIEFFQDEKERLNAVVIYVIYKIESDPLIDECN